KRSLLPAGLANELVDRGHAWRMRLTAKYGESVSVSEAGVVSRQAAHLPRITPFHPEAFPARLGSAWPPDLPCCRCRRRLAAAAGRRLRAPCPSRLAGPGVLRDGNALPIPETGG